MSVQLIELHNDKIVLFSVKGQLEFEWEDFKIIFNLDTKKTVYINYYEKIMYHKNLILSEFDKRKIEYKIINENELTLYKHINDLWVNHRKEIMAVNQERAYYILRIDRCSLRITSFIINNTLEKINISIIEDEFMGINDETDSYYFFLEVLSKIEEMSINKRLIGKKMGKVIFSGEETYANKLEQRFQERYAKNKIYKLEQNIYKTTKLYNKIAKGHIKDPFNKHELKYSKLQVKLEEDMCGVKVIREIKLVEKNERLPINKEVLFNLTSSLETHNLFTINISGLKVEKKIDFPFGYIFDNFKARVLMEEKDQLTVHIYINNQLIDTWEIDGRTI